MSLRRRESKKEPQEVIHRLNHDDIFIAISVHAKKWGKEHKMILDIMAEIRGTFSFGGLILIFVIVPILVLIIIGLIRLVRYLGGVGREQKLLRLEVGKLADELEQARKQRGSEGGGS